MEGYVVEEAGGFDVPSFRGERSPHGPSAVVLAGASALPLIIGVGLLPVDRTNLVVHVGGWFLCGVVAVTAVCLTWRQDRVSRALPDYERSRLLPLLTFVICAGGFAVGVAHAYLFADELARR